MRRKYSYLKTHLMVCEPLACYLVTSKNGGKSNKTKKETPAPNLKPQTSNPSLNRRHPSLAPIPIRPTISLQHMLSNGLCFALLQ